MLGQAAVRSDTTAGAVEPGDPANGPNENMLGKNISNPLSLIKAIKFLNKID